MVRRSKIMGSTERGVYVRHAKYRGKFLTIIPWRKFRKVK